jgi:hypothetical protein
VRARARALARAPAPDPERARRTASITLLLPAPFGPMTALKDSLKGPMTCLPG